MSELIVILIIALLVLGPKRLPDVAKGLGKALREFRRATSDLKEEFHAEDLGSLDLEEDIRPEPEEEKRKEPSPAEAQGAPPGAAAAPPGQESTPPATAENPPAAESAGAASSISAPPSEPQPKATRDHA